MVNGTVAIFSTLQQFLHGNLVPPSDYAIITVYAVIFKGRKIQGFCCNLAELEILILKKKHLRNNLMISKTIMAKILSDLPSTKYKIIPYMVCNKLFK